jgi:hypothetical protein
LLEYRAIAKHTRFAAAAFGAIPTITAKFSFAIDALELDADAILQIAKVGEDGA